ncbi:hypothetical protein [Aureimonas ureilytica]|uniref:hypothetical protein n=1 Tax=Aureimonas ureilytica TaxID=401562 RepID=UPI0012DDA4B8|nr:hypothetical protein [Aureimonas ureilytica]
MGEITKVRGPWSVRRSPSTDTAEMFFDIVAGDGTEIVGCEGIVAGPGDEECAHLIAAAPEMMEALRETQSLLVAMLHEQRPRAEIEAQIVENRAALPKAEGRSPSSASGQEGGE